MVGQGLSPGILQVNHRVAWQLRIDFVSFVLYN